MTTATLDQRIAEQLVRLRHDPYNFARLNWPWRRPGTSLAEASGPRIWQGEMFKRIGAQLQASKGKGCVIQEAVASGHGIGKSAGIAMLLEWALGTCPSARGIVTANTDTQLRTKTWPELAKWHELSLIKDWFRYTATALHSTDPDADKTWRVDAVPWSEHNTEAFAGLHNEGKRIIVVYDESSAISDKIWEVTEGALTDENTEIIWIAFGNPTRNAGRFRQCFGSLAHRWGHQQIDSRTVEGTNKAQIAKWIEDYGEDSDFVRVRVKGQFPRAGSMQFISSEHVSKAATCEDVSPTLYDPVIMGVDVARFGDDESVITIRRGYNCRMYPATHLRGVDTMQLAGKAASLATEYNVDVIFVDGTGIGAGVVDRLRQLGLNVMEVNNGETATRADVEGEHVKDRAAECWALMRSWLKRGGCIPNDPELMGQLEGREYGYDADNAIKLERKDDMKKRGLSSPDRADSLALTFAMNVPPRKLAKGWGPAKPAFCVTDADE